VRRILLGFALLLTACAQRTPVVDETSPPPLPEASYIAAAKAGAAVYRLVPAESIILVRVTRAGPMKRLGHDHAIASEDVQGFVELGAEPGTSRADIAMPLRNLIVDKPSYRDQLGLDTHPSPGDVAGTYANMLKVLEPALHPWVVAQAVIESADGERTTLKVSITMHGTTVEYRLPVTLEIDGTRLIVSGNAKTRQSEFGLKPYQAMGGLLRVADELEITFRLVGAAAKGLT